ncbi:hypothetical protein [Pyrodictium occultum]|uniref:hypothetical protein n=1 Tax=Pyrodictium occultum TaxID=2309 RepID=UPI001442F377|nr:hypothetical protein [Pyrodictium occultum]
MGGEAGWPATSLLAYTLPGVREACGGSRCGWIAALGVLGAWAPCCTGCRGPWRRCPGY